jgi:hypothetical protein
LGWGQRAPATWRALGARCDRWWPAMACPGSPAAAWRGSGRLEEGRTGLEGGGPERKGWGLAGGNEGTRRLCSSQFGTRRTRYRAGMRGARRFGMIGRRVGRKRGGGNGQVARGMHVATRGRTDAQRVARPDAFPWRGRGVWRLERAEVPRMCAGPQRGARGDRTPAAGVSST